MKMVKSLLLVTAAGLVAASGAQAADLPVKAKPVEYVKVCSLYGAGFYYIPGTDICMKLGGYVRYQVNTGMGNNISFGPFFGTGGLNTRNTDVDVGQRVRVNFTMDTRQQTAYGTLRTYLLLGWTHDTPAVAIGPTPSVYFNRGFIQIAGFTFGKATSFFDFASTAAVAYNAGFLSTSDTGDAGQIVAAYTAQFGNGMSATISMEQSRRNATTWFGGATVGLPGGPLGVGFVPGVAPGFDNLGGAGAAGTASRPDFVANWRIDQAWGSAQIMGALHDVSAAYYGGPGVNVLSDHPSDKWGWAAGFGLRLNAPMIGPGDYFQMNAIYSEGAPRYASFSGCGQSFCTSVNGTSYAFGWTEDAVFTGTPGAAGVAAVPGTFNLMTAWSVFASYEHFWTPALRTSLYGSYVDFSRNAAGNAIVCTSLNAAQFAAFTAGTFGCDMDYQTWAVGSRSQWNVTKDLYVGIDVIYSKLQGANINNGLPFTTAGTTLTPAQRSVTLYNTADQDRVSVTWRVHRDIVP
jgi:hypothetical protein